MATRELFIDFETTGFPKSTVPDNDIEQPFAVQCGTILRHEGMIVLQNEFLVKVPAESCEEALAVHGISKELTDEAGVPPFMLVDHLDFVLSNADVAIAHNWHFEKRMMEVIYARSEGTTPPPAPESFCTMQKSRPFFNGKVPKLGMAFDQFATSESRLKAAFFGEAHSALADAFRCMTIYDHLKNSVQ